MKGLSKRKVQDSKSQWLRDAKWGFFTHYLAHVASDPQSVIPKLSLIRSRHRYLSSACLASVTVSAMSLPGPSSFQTRTSFA